MITGIGNTGNLSFQVNFALVQKEPQYTKKAIKKIKENRQCHEEIIKATKRLRRIYKTDI